MGRGGKRKGGEGRGGEGRGGEGKGREGRGRSPKASSFPQKLGCVEYTLVLEDDCRPYSEF